MYSSNNPPHYWFSASRPTGAPLNGIEIPGWFQNLCIRWDFGKHLIFQIYPYLSLKSPSHDLETSSDKRLTVSWSRAITNGLSDFYKDVPSAYTPFTLRLLVSLRVQRCRGTVLGTQTWIRSGLHHLPPKLHHLLSSTCVRTPWHELLLNFHWNSIKIDTIFSVSNYAEIEALYIIIFVIMTIMIVLLNANYMPGAALGPLYTL